MVLIKWHFRILFYMKDCMGFDQREVGGLWLCSFRHRRDTCLKNCTQESIIGCGFDHIFIEDAALYRIVPVGDIQALRAPFPSTKYWKGGTFGG